MTQYEVPEPIINSPFDEPGQHWYIRQGEAPEIRARRVRRNDDAAGRA